MIHFLTLYSKLEEFKCLTYVGTEGSDLVLLTGLVKGKWLGLPFQIDFSVDVGRLQ